MAQTATRTKTSQARRLHKRITKRTKPSADAPTQQDMDALDALLGSMCDDAGDGPDVGDDGEGDLDL